jgi:hypothetical protein
MQIVYARAEQTKMVPTGRHVTRDMNIIPEFRFEWEGKAGMYLRKGKEADIAKAKKWLEAEGYTILTFPTTEQDPLGKAKAIVVSAVTQS